MRTSHKDCCSCSLHGVYDFVLKGLKLPKPEWIERRRSETVVIFDVLVDGQNVFAAEGTLSGPSQRAAP
jgi:hypothetical protein